MTTPRMKLFYSPTSPYARKVRLVLRERGILDQVEEVAVQPLDDPAELLAVSPMGKVPTLVDPNGRGLVDSRVIALYLDGVGEAARLRSATDPNRAITDAFREAFADGIADAAVSSTMERRRPEAERSPAHLARQRARIERGIDHLETGHLALDVEHPGIGDLALGAVLAYVAFRLPELGWPKRAPRLHERFSALAERPSMQATAFPGAR